MSSGGFNKYIEHQLTSVGLVLLKKTNWIFTSDTDALNRSGDMQIMPAASQ